MSDSRPDRTKRRRLPSAMRVFGVAMLLLASVGFILVFWQINAMHNQARQMLKDASTIGVGDSRADVVSLLGNPDLSYNAGLFEGFCYGQRETLTYTITSMLNRFLGREEPVIFDDWLIHIRFDSSGNVDRIKRGENLVAP